MLLPCSSLGAAKSLVLHMLAGFALVVNLDFLKENTERKTQV